MGAWIRWAMEGLMFWRLFGDFGDAETRTGLRFEIMRFAFANLERTHRLCAEWYLEMDIRRKSGGV
jgi:hypothetical protein